MKAVARSYMWWPGMDGDLENLAKSCTVCQAVKSAPSAAPLHPWLWPDQPWQRIHIDYAGPFRGKMFLLLIDAHSKWPEIFEMASTTSGSTIAMLRRVFAAYGLPEHLVSDNGPQFTSTEFREFLRSNRVKHIQTAPYHPASNGAVERLVQTFKQAMKAGEQDGFTLQHQLQNFLITYCSTPHATTGQSLASLFLGRPLCTRFDLLRPMVGERVRGEQARQKHNHDGHRSYREFPVGTHVMVREGRDKSHWLPGTVRERRGPVSYLVELDSGVWCRRHVDHLREMFSPTTTPISDPTSKEENISSGWNSTRLSLSEPSDSSSEERAGDTLTMSSLETQSSITPSPTVASTTSTSSGTITVPEDVPSQSSSVHYLHRYRRPVVRFTVTY